MPLPLPLSEPGPVLTYLSKLRQADPAQWEKTRVALRFLLETPDGVMLLDLLEKATVHSLLPILADPRALEARNAQALIARDLRRITTDETEQLVQQQNQLASARPALGRPRSSGANRA
jgi:hypothetical protein